MPSSVICTKLYFAFKYRNMQQTYGRVAVECLFKYDDLVLSTNSQLFFFKLSKVLAKFTLLGSGH